jgi:hypothetical protein
LIRIPAITPDAPVIIVHQVPLLVRTAHGGERVGSPLRFASDGSFRVSLIRSTFEPGV